MATVMKISVLWTSVPSDWKYLECGSLFAGSERAAQGTLGRGHRIGLARVDLDRGAQRAGQRLVAAFHDMVIVLTIEVFHVQRHAGGLREGLEPFLEQLGVHLAQLVAGEI